jgi:hypothetical protein
MSLFVHEFDIARPRGLLAIRVSRESSAAGSAGSCRRTTRPQIPLDGSIGRSVSRAFGRGTREPRLRISVRILYDPFRGRPARANSGGATALVSRLARHPRGPFLFSLDEVPHAGSSAIRRDGPSEPFGAMLARCPPDADSMLARRLLEAARFPYRARPASLETPRRRRQRAGSAKGVERRCVEEARAPPGPRASMRGQRGRPRPARILGRALDRRRASSRKHRHGARGDANP